jgi:hypothetical protein
MLSQRLGLGMKLVLGIMPIYYGAILLVALPDTWQWLAGVAAVLVSLLFLCISLDYPLQTVWPIFPGIFLILACSCMLYQGTLAQFPLTRQPNELIAMYIVGALYIVWAARATWKAYSIY